MCDCVLRVRNDLWNLTSSLCAEKDPISFKDGNCHDVDKDGTLKVS